MRASEIVTDGERVYHLGLRKEDVARNIFFAGDPARAERISGYFDSLEREVRHREFVTYTGKYKGIPVSVIGTGIGTDNVEIALVELYVLNEFDLKTKQKTGDAKPLTIIRLGTSGGVQTDVVPGSQSIASYALGLDSTGIYYESSASDELVSEIENSATRILKDSVDPNSRFVGSFVPYASKASESVVNALEQAAQDLEIRFSTGITVSAPGFYGPSSRFIDGIVNTVPDIKHDLARLSVNGIRILNMEMESSLMFHLCSIFGYRAGTICAVISGPDESDELIDYQATIGATIRCGLLAMEKLNDDEI